jgi:hypothetical protein
MDGAGDNGEPDDDMVQVEADPVAQCQLFERIQKEVLSVLSCGVCSLCRESWVNSVSFLLSFSFVLRVL